MEISTNFTSSFLNSNLGTGLAEEVCFRNIIERLDLRRSVFLLTSHLHFTGQKACPELVAGLPCDKGMRYITSAATILARRL